MPEKGVNGLKDCRRHMSGVTVGQPSAEQSCHFLPVNFPRRTSFTIHSRLVACSSTAFRCIREKSSRTMSREQRVYYVDIRIRHVPSSASGFSLALSEQSSDMCPPVSLSFCQESSRFPAGKGFSKAADDVSGSVY